MSLRDIVENQTIKRHLFLSSSFIPFYATTSLLLSQHLIKIYKQHKYFQCIVSTLIQQDGLPLIACMGLLSHGTPREGLICHQITGTAR